MTKVTKVSSPKKSQRKKNILLLLFLGILWVTGEVRIYFSVFQNKKSIIDLKDKVNLRYVCEDMFKDLNII